MNKELDEETLQDLYAWIDKIPLSRPKRNITRDFSDGVMAAEVVKFYFPKLVELHNYTPANSTHQKLNNWGTLNRKVFAKLNFHVPEDTIKKISLCTAGLIESVLCTLREKIEDKRLGALEERGPQDLEYYSTTNEKSRTGMTAPLYKTPVVGKAGGPVSVSESARFLHVPRAQPTTVTTSHMDPTFRLLMEEKEQALLALKETVEILQIKVNRLEHLVQLKDLRIEDLTRHVERYRTRANMA
ncbi:sperm flagellar protein 1 [Anguilla anguilla]|uniref:sperm flagellar protein 1 n=1 Tax=Anguilla anguilla TaxID=7936 RepID=UPI0015B30DEA|nr:sperm flagellar protein 1 [Anguilla anguilla]